MPVYVLHIEPPFQHASHYIGFTTYPEVADRVAIHLAGRGSPLIKAALDAGHEVTVAHSWRCGTRLFERYLKNLKQTPRWCRTCGRHEKRKPTFAAFRRYLFAGGRVRPSRRYFALAAFARVSVEAVQLMTAKERRELDEKLRAAEHRQAA